MTTRTAPRRPSAPPPAVSLHVVTLGSLGFEGSGASGGTKLLGQPKRMAVLLYVLLAPRGRVLTRDRVLGVFWPDASADRARNALRQTSSFVRKCVGTDALVNVGTHGLSVGDSIDCDALRFEALLDAGRREDALRLYRGEFLPSFHINGSREFSDWLDERRAHFKHRAAKAAWDLSTDAELAGDHGDAAYWGKRALALSPFSESEVQRLLRLLGRIGDAAGALRAFHGLQRALDVDFGAKPSTETIRLVTEISDRVAAEGVRVPALLGTRRSGADRRTGERRESRAKWTGVERRKRRDRRSRQRRSGRDRRDLR